METVTKRKRNPRKMFTPTEDSLLKDLVRRYGTYDWKSISEFVKGRGPRQCRDRYLKYLSPEVVNGPWTHEEEELLVEKYNIFGSSWKLIATFFPTRTDVNIKSKWKKMQRRMNKERLKFINQNNTAPSARTKSKDYEMTNFDIQSNAMFNIFPDDGNEMFDDLWSSMVIENDFFFNCEV